ncbi:cell division protein ZipA [Thalassotalea aquiviva]|uniref:cell division protein ZipA n=1 Tax=Thalassotalea aquiviva TaxID=3242415 RepID=UPI00352B85E7
MEVNFRLILIIISVIAILAIYLNGRYKIRKGLKNPYKLKSRAMETATSDLQNEVRTYDNDGFDQDGIGRITPIVSDLDEPLTPPQDLPQPPLMAESDDVGDSPSLADIENFDKNFTPVEEEFNFGEPSIVAPEPKVQPVTNPETISKPLSNNTGETAPAEVTTKVDKPSQAKTKAELKRDQLEIDFNNKDKVDVPEQEVLALSVVVNEGMISGATLLPTLLTLGMKYGEMEIFHRHLDNAGNGDITFSLANMVNPGTFDLDNMENFTTQGVTLFMTLPNAGEPVQVFKYMLSAAKQIAKEVNGQVLDGKRSVMTAQTEQHYLSQIREFDRKCRLAGV